MRDQLPRYDSAMTVIMGYMSPDTQDIPSRSDIGMVDARATAQEICDLADYLQSDQDMSSDTGMSYRANFVSRSFRWLLDEKQKLTIRLRCDPVQAPRCIMQMRIIQSSNT